MENRSNYAIVGAVVLGIVLALFAAVLWLAKFSGGDEKPYDILFNQSTSGLATGAPVAFNGVPVGKVENISLVPGKPELVRVRISVDSKVPILQGTAATVEGVGFTGVSQVQLSGAIEGAKPITGPSPYGAPLIPPKAGAIGQLLASAPELLKNCLAGR